MTAHSEDLQRIASLPGLFDSLPLPLQVYELEGLLFHANRAQEQMWGLKREEWIGHFNLLNDPQIIAQGYPALFQKAAHGETVITPLMRYNAAQGTYEGDKGHDLWFEAILFPITNESGTITHIGVVNRDVTPQVEQAQAIAETRRELAEQRELTEQAQRELEQARALESARQEIAAQRETILALSSPVVQVWEGILTVPLIGVIDAQRAVTITENLLEAIMRCQAESVILDITGVATVDTQVANYLLQAARACRLLGTEVVMVGINNEVAQTLVYLGLDLNDVVTRANLQAGIAWAFERRNLVVVGRGLH